MYFSTLDYANGFFQFPKDIEHLLKEQLPCYMICTLAHATWDDVILNFEQKE